ncbi:50S ribosomal protein L33 [candidate division KSB1 bacterium]|nr:50S ribosomal protein L33 [candidate division KSB1 bacterium]
MASKKKEGRVIIHLECTEAKAAGCSPSRYTTMKNRHNDPERMELKKYNPFMKKYTVHREVR